MSRPTYVIAATPPTSSRVRGFYHDDGDSVKVAITHPHRFRWAGFDLSTGTQPVLKDDEFYELTQSDRKTLRLYKDGTLVFRAAADHDFLGWGQEPSAFEQTPRLNPVAVVEVHASFVTLYSQIARHITPEPAEILFSLTLRNARFEGKPLLLTQYYSSGFHNVNMPTLHRVHSDEASDHVRVNAQDVITAPLRVAYRLVTTFYGFFDMDHTLIPFVAGDADAREIDVTALQRL